MAVTTAAIHAPAVSTYYDRLLLRRAEPNLVHEMLGQRRPLKLHSGQTAKFRRIERLTDATAPLTDGVDVTAVTPTITDVTVTIAEYGNAIEFTELCDMVNQDPIVSEYTSLLGDNAGSSLDVICRNVINAGTSVRYSSADANRAAVVHLLTTGDLDIAIRTLNRNNAKHFEPVMKASTGVGTAPLRSAFWGIVHPDVYYTLEGLTGFIPVSDYPNPGSAKPAEVGSYKNIRFLMTTNARIWADSGAAIAATGYKSTTGVLLDVYSTLIVAEDAFGVVPLGDGSYKTVRKQYGWNDLLDRMAAVGYKAKIAYVILNDNFMTRIETAAVA